MEKKKHIGGHWKINVIGDSVKENLPFTVDRNAFIKNSIEILPQKTKNRILK